MSTTRTVPRGTLRISSSFGFGRHIIAPALLDFTARFPQLNVRLDLFDRLVDVAGEGYDLDVRIGDEIADHLIARRLAANYRVLCGARLSRAARRSLNLASHDCLAIKERDHPFGVWRLNVRGETATVKVGGALSTNHGEVAVQWALAGRGIVLRSIWEAAPLIERGAPLCGACCRTPSSPRTSGPCIRNVAASAKVRVCVDFLVERWPANTAAGDETA